MNMESVKDEVALRASAISLAFSLESPFLLRCALRLKIPDIIWKAGRDVSLSVQQIAAQLPSEDPDLGALSRILSYLSTMGILQAVKAEEEGINMKYGLTNLSKSYFTSEDINPRSLVPLVLLQTHPAYVTAWANIHERVLHGGDNWKKSSGNGKDFWSFAGSDPKFSAIFNAGMVAVTKATMEDVLAVYDGFKDVNTLVDVGGGHGDALSLIIDAYPHIQGINFDLPQVIATAPTLPGVQHISGSLFETAAPSADAIFMKNFLHSWNDEDCIKLLNNCYHSVPHKGKLILSEAVLDLTEGYDMIESANIVDAVMLNCLPGGGERTRKQWTELLQAAGFSLSKIVGRKGTVTKVIEAIKC